jgi:hypothetical protein
VAALAAVFAATTTSAAGVVLGPTSSPAGAGVPDITITNPNPLPPATVGEPYSVQLQVSGGVGPYTFSVLPSEGGAVPPGLSISSSGLVSGVPVQQADQPVSSWFWVYVTDSSTPQESTQSTGDAVSIQVSPQGYVPPPPLQITTTSLPAATLNDPYSATLQAIGGTSPYAWYVDNLPQGFTMSSGGVITGSSEIPQQTTITVTVIDSGKQYDLGNEGTSDEQQQTAQEFTFTVSSGEPSLDPTLFGLQLPALVAATQNLPSIVQGELSDLLAEIPGGGPTGLPFYVVDQIEELAAGTLCPALNNELGKGICGP